MHVTKAPSGTEGIAMMAITRRAARVGLVAALIALALGARPGIAHAFTVSTVTNTNDSGGGSLRQAILDADANPGPDAIQFNISGPGVHTIAPLSPLPPVTDKVSIGGWTQPGYAGTPLIQLDGGNSVAAGLEFQAGGEVGGLDVVRFTSAGIVVRGDGVTVAHNVIGADPTGTVAMGNGVGVLDAGQSTLIGGPGVGNVVSGNLGDGIVLSGQSRGAVVTQNLIGLSPSGLALGNGANGILAECTPKAALIEDNVISANGWGGTGGFGVNILGCGLKSGHVVQGNLIGTNVIGTFPFPNNLGGVHVVDTRGILIGGEPSKSEGNVISGNNGPGVWVDTGAAGTAVDGNLIGVTAIPIPGHEGVPLPNSGSGVLIQDGETTRVGKPDAGNVISGNQGGGVRIEDSQSTDVFGNLIGTDVTGEQPVGNVGPGVEVDGGRFTFLGGGIPGQGNVISANSGDGVLVRGSDFTGQPARDVGVMANLIGTGSEPGSVLGNGGNGITVGPNASGTRIGRVLGPTMANVIEHNAGAGIGVVGSTGVQITGNATSDNGGLGIDLGLDGVTPNDGPGDPDTGANDLQNFPVLSNVILSKGALSVHMHLDSTNNSTYAIELFFNLACDPSGFGEGTFFVTGAKAKTGANGKADLDLKVPGVTQIPILTATATDTKTLDTSEFSRCT